METNKKFIPEEIIPDALDDEKMQPFADRTLSEVDIAKEDTKFPNVAINSQQFKGMKTVRQKKRHNTRLINEGSLYCSQLVDLFFKYVKKDKDLDNQADELERLNIVWKNYIRSKPDRYVYTECSYLFLNRIKFMIGDRKINKTRLAEIDAAGENDNTKNA